MEVRVKAAIWALACLLLAVGAQGPAASAADGRDGALRAARKGQVLRIWPLVFGPTFPARGYRILYRSTGMNGEPIVVSGAIIFPVGPAPASGRPVIAWAHPTTGVADKCAPSLVPVNAVQGLDEMIGRGYVVVATDYPGLGTKGMHPYLIGVSEARAVLDSVRAAR